MSFEKTVNKLAGLSPEDIKDKEIDSIIELAMVKSAKKGDAQEVVPGGQVLAIAADQVAERSRPDFGDRGSGLTKNRHGDRHSRDGFKRAERETELSLRCSGHGKAINLVRQKVYREGRSGVREKCLELAAVLNCLNASSHYRLPHASKCHRNMTRPFPVFPQCGHAKILASRSVDFSDNFFFVSSLTVFPVWTWEMVSL